MNKAAPLPSSYNNVPSFHALPQAWLYIIAMLLCVLRPMGMCWAQTPYLQANSSQPITVLGNPAPTVALFVTASGFTPTGVTWAQVPDTINHMATAGVATFGTQGTTTSVTLPAKGVYEFQATATSSVGTFTANTWVQVWDSRGSMNPGVGLGTNPGVDPPTSIRTLSATPPAGVHPRVLFTDADWPDFSTRGTTGVVASWGVSTLRKWVANSIDAPTSADGEFAAALLSWYQAGMTSSPPDPTPLSEDGQLSCGANGAFPSMLLDACYLQWLDNNPATPHSQLSAAAQQRGAYLAELVAASASLRFMTVWNPSTNQFNFSTPVAITSLNVPGEPASATGLSDLAMAYDLIYNWMSTTEQQQSRDFLFAAQWGRHTSFAGWSRGVLNSAIYQNGDFGNTNDQEVLVELAIEGEESAVSPNVQTMFGTPVSGSYDVAWVKMANASSPAAWPNATQADVDNLQRELSWLTDWWTTPWGLAANHIDYLGLTAQDLLPSSVAYARRGENTFVTTNMYQLAMHCLLVAHPGETANTSSLGLGSSNFAFYDHHDSADFGQRGTFALIMKYMYPDDPLVDYMYRIYLPNEYEDPLTCALFGIDPSVNIPAQATADVAAAKNIPLTHFDPQRGVVSMHSAWDDDAASLWFECMGGDAYCGHMHAERNSFDFFALGRAWACAPGYHETISDMQSAILVRDPRYVNDAPTNGFIGESASSATEEPGFLGNHPTPPGQILQLTDAPDHSWTLVAGDATPAYNYGYTSLPSIDTGYPLATWMFPGLQSMFQSLDSRYSYFNTTDLTVQQTAYNTMRRVYRTVLFVRGPQPYALVVDDDDKDDAPHDWQWVMNDSISFGSAGNRFVDANGNTIFSSLQMAPGATATDAVLYHTIDSASNAGLPRLLLRDVGLANPTGQPAIILQTRPSGQANTPYLTYGIDNNDTAGGYVKIPSNRVIIERDGMAQPGYTVLMFPFLTGQALPTTSWNANRSILTVTLSNGTTNMIQFDRSQPDNRTRLYFLGTSAPSVPTIATAASASPDPVAGTTTNLSVLGADAGGESNLTYAWTASGPAPVKFSANLTNAAKNCVATFTQAGTYTINAAATNALGYITSSSVTVVVNQTITNFAALPSSVTVPVGRTQQFTAVAIDQFGAPLSSTAQLVWSASSYGTISSTGLFTAGSAAGSSTITAAIGSTVSKSALASSSAVASLQINSGGGKVGTFAADEYTVANGVSLTSTTSTAIDTSGAVNPAPAAVYQSYRWGQHFTYTLPGLVPGTPYGLRLHFAETQYGPNTPNGGGVGSREFNVAVNGQPVLTNFDVFATAGAAFKAVVENFPVVADSNGNVAVAFTQGAKDYTMVSGIELLSTEPSQVPTVATAASATPSPVTGTTTTLSVLGADTRGEANLIYNWTSTGPALVSFSSNLSNVAKNTIATFSQSGTYNLTVTVVNAEGGVASSTIPVTVNQSASAIAISPTTTGLSAGQAQQYAATAVDQFGMPINPTPPTTWTATGVGAISSAGTYSAGTTPGSATVTGSIGAVSSLPSYVTVTAGVPATVEFAQQPTNTTVGFAISPSVAAEVADAYGNPLSGVSVTLSSTATLTGTLTAVTNSAGIATFAGVAPESIGSYTLTAGLSGSSPTATSSPFTVSVVTASPTPVFQINAAGGAVSPYVADEDYTGGNTASYSNTINVTGVANPAPQAIYQTERWGQFTYKLPGLVPGAPYTLRLHFAETYFGPSLHGGGIGSREFNVSINGNAALTNFDIYATAGGSNIAIVKSFAVNADSSGNVTVAFTNGAHDNPKVDGVQLLTTVTATTASVSPSAPNGTNGWYVSPVTVTLASAPGTLPVAAIYYTVDGGPQQTYANPFVVASDGDHTVSYWSVDSSGNVEVTHTATFKIDATPPTLAFGAASPSQNAAGWNDTPVTVPFTLSDATSGVSSTNPASSPVTFSAQGANQTQTLTVTDAAGNAATFTSPSVSIDLTAPTTTSMVVGSTVTLTATDNLSGVSATYDTLDGGAPQAYAAPFAVSAPGAHTVAYWSVDVAGNVEATHTLAVTNPYPKPSLSSVSPSTLYLGATTAQTLTLAGTGFTSASVAEWNGMPLPTTFVSATGLTASVAPSQLSTVGSATVIVVNPAPGAELSGGKTVKLALPTASKIWAPSRVYGGATGTVEISLNSPAPAGYTVAITSASPSIAMVPSSFSFPVGATTVSFLVPTVPVAANVIVAMKATGGGKTVSGTIIVEAPVVSKVSVSPSSVYGGTASVATVTLNAPAPAAYVATLSSSASSAASVPPSVTFAAGSTTATVTVATSPVGANAAVVLTATAGGTPKTATLTVKAATVSKVGFAPSTVQGGSSTTATVTLNGPAPAGFVVTLTNSSPSVATIPATLAFAAGATTATLSVPTNTVPSAVTVTMSASGGGSTHSGNVKVIAP